MVCCLRWIRAKRGTSWMKMPKEVFEGLEGNCERPIPSRFVSRLPCCDRRDSPWGRSSFVMHPAPSTNAPTHSERGSPQGGAEVHFLHVDIPTCPPNCWLAFKGHHHHHHPPQHHLPGTGLSPISPRLSSESTQWVESGPWWEGPEAGAFKERQRAKGG